jgi:subtilisin family serine protease
MDHEIKIKRGNREVTFKKLRNLFAVRLKQGVARSPEMLGSTLGDSGEELKHAYSIAPERMEVFRIADPNNIEHATDSLRKAKNSDVVSHVYTVDGTEEGAVVPTGTLTIQFKPGVDKARKEKILAEFGLEVIKDLPYMPEGHTVRLTDESDKNPLKICEQLQRRDEITTAEPDLAFRIRSQYRPSDSLFAEQWHLANHGDHLGLAEGADVKAEEAWDVTRGDRDITICIIDDGFDLSHPDFDVPGKIVAPRDFGQNDFDPNPASEEDNHGTCCAGVALAEENGIGVVGLAPQCSFMPIRMADNLSDGTLVDYFEYAMNNGADVISCSWSAWAAFFPLSQKVSAMIHHVATKGRTNQKGCVILFAAGNENSPLDGVKDGIQYHQGFALHPDVISVAASNSLDQRASYSNYGPEITVCAPSSGSPGRGIVTTDRRGTRGYTAEDYCLNFGGTSSATPLAAGLAALILSVNPALAASEVKGIMMETADKIDLDNGQYIDGHSSYFGHGRINAARAVLSLRAKAGQGNNVSTEKAPNVDQPPKKTFNPDGENLQKIFSFR